MIYTGLGRLGEIADVKAHGGADVAEVYGGINESNPIYYKAITITGTSPLTFKGLGLPLKDYCIYGNTVQNGTPTPEAPVDVVGCGEKTENLFDGEWVQGGININGNPVISSERIMSYQAVQPNTTYTFSSTKYVLLIYGYNGGEKVGVIYDLGSNLSHSVTFTTQSKCTRIGIAIAASTTATGNILPSDISDVMLNTGSTALHYEPYGYKLPLAVNGTEYPIYLGQVPTTRQIRKLVLTGNEDWQTQTSQYRNDTALFLIWQRQLVKMRNRPSMNTHFISAETGVNPQTQGFVCSGYHPNADYSDYYYIRPHFTTIGITSGTTGLDAITAFKSWLAAQYANGTPVTVWYVLATEGTGIVNEPLQKIGDYADTISMAQAGVTIPTVAGANTLTVDTTVQPSAVSITGNIKEVSR